jgi:Rps23 Pro-64 3,4-dihydroxylase Tpa1-like proline 4-hydroxylase
MDKVTKISNFLDKKDCNMFIDFMENNIDLFKISDERTAYPNMRYTMRFGYDDEFPDLYYQNLSVVSEIEHELKSIFFKTINKINKNLKETNELYLTSFFLSKHVPGSVLPPHSDAGKDFNSHMEYAALIYLNSLVDSGYLYFKNINKRVDVKTGDIVIFPCKSKEYVHEVPNINNDRYSIAMWFTKNKDFSFNV